MGWFLLVGLIIGLVLGFVLHKKIAFLCVSCYFISTGRTVRASDDFSRVVLNGKYVEEFNKVRINFYKANR